MSCLRARARLPPVLTSRILPNSIARSKIERKVFVGDEVDSCRDLSGLAFRRPFEKVCRHDSALRDADLQGMLVNWDAEKIVWDRLFSADVLDVSMISRSLLCMADDRSRPVRPHCLSLSRTSTCPTSPKRTTRWSLRNGNSTATIGVLVRFPCGHERANMQPPG